MSCGHYFTNSIFPSHSRHGLFSISKRFIDTLLSHSKYFLPCWHMNNIELSIKHIFILFQHRGSGQKAIVIWFVTLSDLAQIQNKKRFQRE